MTSSGFTSVLSLKLQAAETVRPGLPQQTSPECEERGEKPTFKYEEVGRCAAKAGSSRRLGSAGEEKEGDRGDHGGFWKPPRHLSGGSLAGVLGFWQLTHPHAPSSPPDQILDLAPRLCSDPPLPCTTPFRLPCRLPRSGPSRPSAKALRVVASWPLRSKLPITDSAQLDPRPPAPCSWT